MIDSGGGPPKWENIVKKGIWGIAFIVGDIAVRFVPEGIKRVFTFGQGIDLVGVCILVLGMVICVAIWRGTYVIVKCCKARNKTLRVGNSAELEDTKKKLRAAEEEKEDERTKRLKSYQKYVKQKAENEYLKNEKKNLKEENERLKNENEALKEENKMIQKEKERLEQTIDRTGGKGEKPLFLLKE